MNQCKRQNNSVSCELDLDVRAVLIQRWRYNGNLTEVKLFTGSLPDARVYYTKALPGVVFDGLLRAGIIRDASYVWVSREGNERYFSDIAGTKVAELPVDDSWEYITRVYDNRLEVKGGEEPKKNVSPANRGI